MQYELKSSPCRLSAGKTSKPALRPVLCLANSYRTSFCRSVLLVLALLMIAEVSIAHETGKGDDVVSVHSYALADLPLEFQKEANSKAKVKADMVQYTWLASKNNRIDVKWTFINRDHEVGRTMCSEVVLVDGAGDPATSQKVRMGVSGKGLGSAKKRHSTGHLNVPEPLNREQATVQVIDSYCPKGFPTVFEDAVSLNIETLVDGLRAVFDARDRNTTREGSDAKPVAAKVAVLRYLPGVGACRGQSVYIENLTNQPQNVHYQVSANLGPWYNRSPENLRPRDRKLIGCTQRNPSGSNRYRIV